MPLITGSGTQIVVQEDGYLLIVAKHEKYELKEGERFLKGFRSLDISMKIDDIVRGEGEMYIIPHVSFSMEKGDYSLFAEIPENKWEPKRIATIYFKDGQVWEDESLVYEEDLPDESIQAPPNVAQKESLNFSETWKGAK